MVGWLDDGSLKLEVSEPPADGRANAAVVSLLSRIVGLPRVGVRIVSGQGSRRKRVEFDGVDAVTVRRRIDAALEGKTGGEGMIRGE